MKSKNKKLLPVYISVAVVLFLCIFASQQKAIAPNNFSIGGVHLNIEIADTETERNLGLSGRNSLATDVGLLFIFEKPQIAGIWMKDMKFPIDIVWIDENLRVIHIKENATPQSFPEIFIPSKNSLYVLEINAGFVEKNKIKVGDSVVF